VRGTRRPSRPRGGRRRRARPREGDEKAIEAERRKKEKGKAT